METVFAAMSGGFDSCLAAWMLKKAGHKVVGVTFSLFPERFLEKWGLEACSSRAAVTQAQRFCRDLSIPHHVIDLSDVFLHRVIEPFIEGYRRGITPNPCVLCNRFVKFGAFRERAMAMGADMIATGHYARSESPREHAVLRKGRDATKDQSYFLYSIGQEALMRAVFPLGDCTKEGLRALAASEGLRCALSRESQDICFIPNGNYAEFLSRFIKPKRGRVYLPDGTRLGFHEGIHLFTIGQRRGINIPYREALYVIEIHADENSIVVGTKKDLRTDTLTARPVSLLYPLTTPISARVRYRQPDKPCSCEFRGETLSVTFHEPVDGVTPGQSVVLYHDDIVVGGGVIEKRVAM